MQTDIYNFSGGMESAAVSALLPTSELPSACADDVRVTCPLFQAEYGGANPTSALQLHIAKMPTRMAMTLNRKWHSRLPELGNSAQCTAYGASCNNVCYAVALWSNPVARLLNGLGMLELRRMAIAPDAPKNTGSRMLRIMSAIIRRTRPDIKTLVSYQDTEVHTGCIYKAAGWRAIEKEDKRSRPWNHATRPRNEEQTRAEKVRWQIAQRQSANNSFQPGVEKQM